ncbi:MAG: DUF1919 domain-containing protein [Oscillospiraceae bacterium]|nr:DUF1919 domain-containing protein [Oscillospiraceae bacterium]
MTVKPYINEALRRLGNGVRRLRLKNKDFSLLASNCNGACICHDLGLQFRSPFVNLCLSAPDFMKILEAPRQYLELPLEFAESGDYSYPVAMLGDVTIHFMHYATAEEAREQWQRRCRRINWDNLFVLMTDKDGCDEALLRRFDALPYPNKAVFTHLPRPEIASAVYIPGFEEEPEVGNCVEYVNGWSGKRYYNYFDYVKWFNGE